MKDKGHTQTGKRYPFTVESADGYVFKTWEDRLAERAKDAAANRERLVVEYKETRYGFDIVSLESVSELVETPAESAVQN